MSFHERAGLTVAETRALVHALHLEETINAACGTGRALRLATMRRLEKRRLVKETVAAMCDGDGFITHPERERRCFELTGSGRRLAKTVCEMGMAA